MQNSYLFYNQWTNYGVSMVTIMNWNILATFTNFLPTMIFLINNFENEITLQKMIQLTKTLEITQGTEN